MTHDYKAKRAQEMTPVLYNFKSVHAGNVHQAIYIHTRTRTHAHTHTHI